jgi:hypothetical protein
VSYNLSLLFVALAVPTKIGFMCQWLASAVLKQRWKAMDINGTLAVIQSQIISSSAGYYYIDTG